MELNVWSSFCYEGEMSSLLLLLLLRCLQIYSSYGINIKCAYQQTGWRTNRQSMLTVTSLRAHILSARLNVCCGGIALMRIELNVAYVGMVLLRLLLVAFFLYFYGLRFWHGLCVALCFTLMTTNFLPYRVRMMIFDVRLIT